MTLSRPHAADAVARIHAIAPRDRSHGVLPEREYLIIESVFGLAARRTKASRSANWSGPRR
jgi:hypothetical protein